MLILDRNSVFIAAVGSGVITALLVVLISVQIASASVYAVLAGLVGFGLVLSIYWNPHASAFVAAATKPGTGAGSSPPQTRVSAFSWSDLFAAVGVLASSIVLYAVPSIGRNLIWANWLAISIPNYVRILAAVLLTTFLPGYFLLMALDIERQLKSIEIVTFASLLSLFSIPLVCVAVSALGFTLASFGSIIVVSLNFAALAAFLMVRLVKAQRNTLLPIWNTGKTRKLHAPAFEHLAFGLSVVSVLVLVLAISYRLLAYPPYLIGDQWPHLDAAFLYERYGNPILATRMIPYAYGFYPQWFHIYLASLLSTSGAPLTNTYFAINFLNILGLLALYLLAMSFFKSQKRPVAALTLALALFSGFGWVYDFWLRSTGAYSTDVLTRLVRAAESSYDILFPNTYFGSAHPELTSDLQVMALPALVMLLVLTNRSDLKGWIRYTLISLLTALAFLSHVAEGGMFVCDPPSCHRSDFQNSNGLEGRSRLIRRNRDHRSRRSHNAGRILSFADHLLSQFATVRGCGSGCVVETEAARCKACQFAASEPAKRSEISLIAFASRPDCLAWTYTDLAVHPLCFVHVDLDVFFVLFCSILHVPGPLWSSWPARHSRGSLAHSSLETGSMRVTIGLRVWLCGFGSGANMDASTVVEVHFFN